MESHTPTASAEHDLARKVQQLERQLSDAYQREAATTEVLKVISRSALDVQCVLDTLVTSAARLCDAYDAAILQVDGDVLSLAAHHGQIAFPGPIPVTRGTPSGRAFIERRTIHVADVQAEPDEYPESRERALRSGWHTALSVPLVWGEEAIGVILIRRAEVRPFGDKEVELVATFAGQAVIAIENTRLFEEVQARTRQLSEALDRQTATSEVLRVISSSPGDVEPVFMTMLENATRICEANFGTIHRYDGNKFYPVAMLNVPPALAEFQRKRGSFLPESGNALDRMLQTKAVVHVVDDVAAQVRTPSSRLGGARSLIAVPMLKEDELVGDLLIYRQ